MRIFWYMMLFITVSNFVTLIFMQLFACGLPAIFFKFGPEDCSSEQDLDLSNLVLPFSVGGLT